MKLPFPKSPNEWPPSPSEFDAPAPWGRRILNHRLTGLIAIFLFGFLIYATDGATWMKRLTMCMLFCGLIYTRDDSPSGRWLTIGIIAVGTLLSILLPVLGISVDFLRNSF
jgi:hypothetical protein